MKIPVIFITSTVACCTMAFAASADDKAITPEEKAVRREMFMRAFGGQIRDERQLKGEIVFVNAQKAADKAWVEAGSQVLAKDLCVNVRCAEGSFEFQSPKCVGNITVFVIDDAKLPMSLVAPEAKWSMVNVHALKADKPAYFKARLMKEMTRAVVPLLGGADSQYPLCVMGAVHKADDLDRFVDSRLPVDVIARMKKNMGAVGIAPYRISMYRKACEEGWAPAPTNEYQKIVWDKVHALPTEPIKIKPETKKVRE